VRIHTDNQLLDLLDEIVAGSPRGDRTRPEAAEFWAELLTRDGHPLATWLHDPPAAGSAAGSVRRIGDVILGQLTARRDVGAPGWPGDSLLQGTGMVLPR